MDQQHLDDANRDAAVLGFALSTSPESARLHMVAGAIAHAWSKRGVPLADALEASRNAVAAMHAEVGIHHAVSDAINYRRSMPDLYPSWANVSRCLAATLAFDALVVWATKGWRR